MYLENFLHSKRPVANVALKVSYFLMDNFQMSCEMTSIPKRFLANVALKVFLFFMNSFYMYFKSFKFGSKFWKKCHVTLLMNIVAAANFVRYIRDSLLLP